MMAGLRSISHVFLDLDGTLTDPKPGTTRSVTYALEAMGMPAPEADALKWVIGPPLVESFARLGVADVQEALRLYRERFAQVGLFENAPYAGIDEALERLQAEGYVLCLVTAKPHVYARRITAHFGLAASLAYEFGPELDGTRNDKAELLAHAHALEVTGADPQRSVMVGDGRQDYEAARANGVRSVAVSWGYGDAGEWALADARCSAVGALPDVIRKVI